MKRFAMTCMLKDGPGIIEKYEDYHANPWPAITEGNKRAGVKRVFIYRIQRRLFLFLETADDFDLKTAGEKQLVDPKAKEWDELMRTFQTNVPEAAEGTTWVEMKEIHALDLTV